MAMAVPMAVVVMMTSMMPVVTMVTMSSLGEGHARCSSTDRQRSEDRQR
jgi:hypothetical protein